MKTSNHGRPGLIRRLLHRSGDADSPVTTSRTYTDADGLRTVITCEGCGTTSEVDLEHGRLTDDVAISQGYFARPCANCGRELGAYADRRML